MQIWLKRFHRDERGSLKEIMLILALIVIPLTMVLITAGDKVQQWAAEAFGALSGTPPIKRSIDQ